jgi:hypothetical protein
MLSIPMDAPAIDWSRMAAPQADGYDTDVCLALATTSGSILRPLPYVRRPAGGALTICDGAVAVRPGPTPVLGGPRFGRAPPDHPNLPAAAAYLRRWPAAYAQFTRLVDTIDPYLEAIPPRLEPVTLGSCSHSLEEDFGVICATVNNALGLAQAMVHEMAHQKLRALGVSFESASRLVTNDPAVLLDSPIRKDRRRPMTAVFHAQYSFIHVTCLDLHMITGEADPVVRDHLLMLLARNVPRMEAGMEELTGRVETDAAGSVFVAAFLAWAAEVIRAGNAVLDVSGYGAPTFVAASASAAPRSAAMPSPSAS